MRCRSRFGLLLLAACSLIACGAPAERPTIPYPDLSGAEEAVRRQLEQAIATESVGRQGMHFHAYDFLQAAEACYERAADAQPDEAGWHYLLARVRHRQGRSAEAMAAVESALRLAPEEVPSWLLRAELQAGAGQSVAAEGSYRKALQLDPRSAAALLGLGKLSLAAGSHAEAAALLESAMELAPEAGSIRYPLGLAYRGLGRTGPALEMLSRSGEIPPPVRDLRMDEVRRLNVGMVAHQTRGDGFLEQGRLEEALAEFRQGARATPDDPRVWVNVGHVLERMGRLDEASAALEKALAVAPDHASALFNLGTVLARQGRDDQAVSRYRQALGANPELVTAYFNMGNAQRRLGRFEEARAAFAAVIEREPRHATARVYEALSLVRLGRHAEARSRMDEALELFPDDLRIRQVLVRLLAASPEPDVRDPARAEQLAAPLAREPVPVDHLVALAMVAAARGEFGRAAEIQMQALLKLGDRGPHSLREALEEDLAAYRRGRPSRQPWRQDDPVISPGSLGP